MTKEAIRKLIDQMTLEEKASLLSGADYWHTKGIERLGIPQTMVSDGPHGLRKQNEKADHLGVNESIKAVCFPAGCALGASFNRELLEEQGRHLGAECQAEGVSVLLGPAMNIKRSPLCGRNFEYLSEDPYLAGEIAAAIVRGVQSQNVGTSPKHFAMNNQETKRLSVSAEADERTIREIYLAGFERVVKGEKPWTMMCSYNRINGTYSAANEWLLTKVLREEWGFDGYVMSDWGAVDERITDVKAGLNLEMPGNGGINDKRLAEAVKNGTLDESVLDEKIEQILNIVYRFVENRNPDAVFDMEADHALSCRVAEESMVLLKNNGVLPLSEEEDVVFIGKYAAKPRYQGGGSSHVNSCRVTSALDAAAGRKHITYVQGFDDEKDKIDEKLQQEAVEAAKAAKAAVIFAGLPDSFECEGYDRKHMRLPDSQNRLIAEIAKVQPNTIVLLHNGSPVEMPWLSDVAAVLECYLGGQAVGSAQISILYGNVNPSGRLAETFPVKLEDNPSYLNFPGEKNTVEYKEGVFVGYRYYDTKKMEVLFPFGHGLSYTTFSYENMTIDKEQMADTDTVTVTADITNTGTYAGKEVVQLYVAAEGGSILRPEKELKGFEKIYLEPQETKRVSFTLSKRSFAYWNQKLGDWHVETGNYRILLGKSSRDIVLEKKIRVVSTVKIPVVYDMNTTMGEIVSDPDLDGFLKIMEERLGDSMPKLSFEADESQGEAEQEAITLEMRNATALDTPLRSIIEFGSGKVAYETVQGLAEEMNRLKALKMNQTE